MNKYLKPGNYINFIRSIFFKYQKYYSQLGEDVIINALVNNKPDGFYVDVGANDPKKLNNTYFFYKIGWSGINIEPNLKKFSNLQKKRKLDINLNIGVGNNTGAYSFYNFKEHTLSTFCKETAEDYIKMGHKLMSIEKVQVRTLSEIFDEYVNGKKIDFMSVDTEGNDLEVLKSNNWNKYRPKYIISETLEYKKDGTGKKNNATFDVYMKSIGYDNVFDTHCNTIYCDISSRAI